MPDLHVKDHASSREPKNKRQPDLRSVNRKLHALYAPSRDGVDANLLVFLHGLGDTEQPFFKLGQSLNLPQTAILSIRGFQKVMLLEEDAFSYYESFDNLGELIQNPDPSEALSLLSDILNHLSLNCGWPAKSIHLFGFGQGGSLVAEIGRRWPSRLSEAAPSQEPLELGSIVDVGGSLLSFPTGPKVTMPVLLWRRSKDTSCSDRGFERGFSHFKQTTCSTLQGNDPSSMPASRSEWIDIMRFWSVHLRRLQPFDVDDDVYEVKH